MRVCKKAPKEGLNGGTSITLNTYFLALYTGGVGGFGGYASKEIGGSVLVGV